MSLLEELIKKLRYKQGPALVLNPPEGFTLGIESVEDDVDQYEFIQLFVNNSDDVRTWLPKALAMLNEDGLFWIAFPKKTSKTKSDINRDILSSLVQELSPYRPVSNVSVDEKWSALRFRQQDKVKSKK